LQRKHRTRLGTSSLLGSFQWIYIATLAIAEIEVSFGSLWVGVGVHVGLLVTVILLASQTCEEKEAKFYQALTLGPLIRLISVVLPMSNIPELLRYSAVSLPLFIATFTVARLNNYRASQVYFSLGKAGPQILIALAGIPMGLIEYYILRPVPLISSLAFANVLTGAVVLLISTGFLEEVIFRSIMQRAAIDFLGWKRALFFLSLTFTSLHIIHLSFPDLMFVWAAGVYFSVAVYRSKSILGVTLAHGLNNIILYLIAPLLFHLSWGGVHFQ